MVYLIGLAAFPSTAQLIFSIESGDHDYIWAGIELDRTAYIE